MKLKKTLLAMIIATGATAVHARTDVGVSINLGVPVAPPVVVYEAPPPVAVGYVWVPGYWGWHHDRYIWIRGRHVHARPGHVWVPDRWEHRNGNYHHVHGRWERDGHRGHGKGHDRGRGRGHDRH